MKYVTEEFTSFKMNHSRYRKTHTWSRESLNTFIQNNSNEISFPLFKIGSVEFITLAKIRKYTATGYVRNH